MNNLLRLPSEQEVTSEQIVSCEFSETVNSGTDLTLGSVCSASLKFTVRTEETLFYEGMPLEYYVVEGDVRTLIGVFVCQKPSYQQRNLVEVEAYDMISRTETDLSAWLRENQSLFPMPLLDFAAAVCEQCGLTLANESIPNGDYSVPAFYSDGLTGRQLLQWVGEICARFVRATPDGQVEFAWYNDRRDGLQEAGQSIGPSKGYETVYLFDSSGAQLVDSDGALLITDEVRGHAYFEGSLSYEEYTTAPIQKVQIKQAEDDVGVVWPDVTGNRNTYVISGNLLLATESEDAIKGIAESIYRALLNIQYRPCTVSIPSTTEIRAGDIVEVRDANGGGFITFIFSRTSTGGRDTLESTGSASRNSNTAVNQQKYTNLQGKVLQLQTSVDGLRVVNKDLTGKYAELSLTVDGLTTTVESAVLANLLSDPDFLQKENTSTVTYTDGGAVISNASGYGIITSDLPSTVFQKIQGKELTAALTLWQDDGASWSADNGFISAQFKIEYVDGSSGTWFQLFASRNPYGDTSPKVPASKTEYAIHAEIPDKEISRAYLYLDFQAYAGALHTDGWAVKYADQEYAVKQFSRISQTVDNISLSVNNGSTSSILTLKSGEITFSTAEVQFTGLVSFSDLSTQGKTSIIGDNITAGVIRGNSGVFQLNLDTGKITTTGRGTVSFGDGSIICSNGGNKVGMDVDSSGRAHLYTTGSVYIDIDTVMIATSNQLSINASNWTWKSAAINWITFTDASGQQHSVLGNY